MNCANKVDIRHFGLAADAIIDPHLDILGMMAYDYQYDPSDYKALQAEVRLSLGTDRCRGLEVCRDHTSMVGLTFS